MNNLRKSFAVVGLCTAMMLSGCTDYGTNLASEYKSFFKYSLGDYDISVKEKTEETSGTGKRTWTLEYTNKAGVTHKDLLSTNGLKSDEDNDKIILDFTDDAMAGGAKDQLYEKIVKKYFPVDYKASSGNYDLYKGDGYTVEFYAVNTEISRLDGKKDKKKIQEAIDDDKGYKISDYDLKKYLSEKQNYISVKVILDNHEKEEEAQTKIKKMTDEIQKNTSKDSTYSATLYAQDDYNPDGSFIYGRNVLMGKQTDDENDYTTMENKLVDKLKK